MMANIQKMPLNINATISNTGGGQDRLHNTKNLSSFYIGTHTEKISILRELLKPKRLSHQSQDLRLELIK